MKRRTWGFYAMFVLLVAGILVLSIILGAFIIGALYYSDLLSIERGNPLPVIIMIIFPSLMVGLFLSGLFGRIAI